LMMEVLTEGKHFYFVLVWKGLHQLNLAWFQIKFFSIVNPTRCTNFPNLFYWTVKQVLQPAC
jgi:hypothetical protein